MKHFVYIRSLILLGSLSLTVTNCQAADEKTIFPGETWQRRTPREAAVKEDKLNEFVKAVGGDGVVIRDGYFIKT